MHLHVKESQAFMNNQPINSQKGDNDFYLLMLWHNHCIAQMCILIGTVSHVSDVAHGPLIFFAS